jgi:hypothetical protein
VALLVANQVITDPGWTLWEVTKRSVRQAVTPDALLGRMNSSMRFVEFAGSGLGALLAGVLSGVMAPRGTLFLAAAIMTLPAMALLLSPLSRMPKAPVVVEEVEPGVGVAGGGVVEVS